MFHLLRKLKGYSVLTTDGEIGHIDDFLIDPHEWKTRYMIVDAADWLDGRFVYISMVAVGKPASTGEALPVHVSKEVVRNSPEIAAGKLLTRQQESELHNYFQWPYYWKSWEQGGIGPGNLAAIPMIELASSVEAQETETGDQEKVNLQSLDEIASFALLARDGEIGAVEDVIVDDQDWNILYLIVAFAAPSGVKKVLVSPSFVQEVDRLEAKVRIDLDRKTIQKSPEYDPEQPLDKSSLARLFDTSSR